MGSMYSVKIQKDAGMNLNNMDKILEDNIKEIKKMGRLKI